MSDSTFNQPKAYTLHLDDDLLELTKKKLELARFPEEQSDISDDDWSQGAKVKEIKRLAQYWANGYDWRAEEVPLYLSTLLLRRLTPFQARINAEFNQFKVTMDVPGYGPQTLHYAHQTSSRPDALPLLFVQGWPGSFLEARKIIQPLTNPPDSSTQAFHVIVPSIPGFGPGDPPTKSGFGPMLTAGAFKILMADVLGYKQFVTQGGDWGSMITRSMAMQFPEHVRACHHNFFPCGPPPWYKAPLTMARLMLSPYLYSVREMDSIKKMQYYQKEQNGYLKVQGTRPQSLGFGLGDSPIGLLGWLVEKFHEWMDVANYQMPDDEILTFVMMHWMQGATPGLRYYKMAFAEEGEFSTKKAFTRYFNVPTGLSHFPKEISLSPYDWVAWVANEQFRREHDRGGHFAAVECPELLVQDLRDWFSSDVVRSAMQG
ncbi:MAG: hypothetical protein LQ348_001382 [Seirophora lacunosa]|nr:MAG: hypothetical protein LQ348_001382 [Seirophora lacunosa]